VSGGIFMDVVAGKAPGTFSQLLRGIILSLVETRYRVSGDTELLMDFESFADFKTVFRPAAMYNAVMTFFIPEENMEISSAEPAKFLT
jgi:hypothetical protein